MKQPHISQRLSSSKGQSLVEFAFVVPLSLALVLGVAEVGYALLDQHVVTAMTREGSNLISRDATLQDARIALSSMSARPVDFSTSSTVIFSVIKKVATVGAANYDMIVLYQRYTYGSIPAQSTLYTTGGTFGGPPDYIAVNPDNDTNLRVTNLPANLNVARGGLMYVTEIFSNHTLLTPLQNFGVTVPSTIYSIAYF